MGPGEAAVAHRRILPCPALDDGIPREHPVGDLSACLAHVGGARPERLDNKGLDFRGGVAPVVKLLEEHDVWPEALQNAESIAGCVGLRAAAREVGGDHPQGSEGTAPRSAPGARDPRRRSPARRAPVRRAAGAGEPARPGGAAASAPPRRALGRRREFAAAAAGQRGGRSDPEGEKKRRRGEESRDAGHGSAKSTRVIWRWRGLRAHARKSRARRCHRQSCSWLRRPS